MITLSKFQEALSSKEPLTTPNQSVSGQEHHLLKLLTTLSSQTQEQQAEHLEKVLSVLCEANIDELQCLKLMTAVSDASDRLIATLRQQYIYETGALSEVQLGYVAQVKSLHYLIILAYDKVVRRQELISNSQPKNILKKGFPRYFNTNKKRANTLTVAIYQSLLRYHKLLCEEALCYRKPSDYLWFRINQLYHLAYQQRVSHLELNRETVTPYTNSIHQLYCQICLHSLLNVCAMRRPNVLLVQRLLPEWSHYIVATIEPTTETRVFVDLQSDKPPTYLTPNSEINPYEDRYDCLFLELTPMVQYFNSRRQLSTESSNVGIGHGLLNTISMTVSYRYLQPQLTLPTKYSLKHRASLIAGFNSIHHHVSDSSSFASLIAIDELSIDERPRYDTFNTEQNSNSVLDIEVFDSHDSLSLFRTLRLVPTVDVLNEEHVGEEALDMDMIDGELAATTPPSLHIMSLFLLCQPDVTEQPDRSIGVVRWRHFDTKDKEVEWQLLGHQIVACGLRLEGRNPQKHCFVPALILGKDEQLQTMSSLIVPSSYFQPDDRVIMRISSKQTHLRLGRRLMITEGFSQYEIAK